MDAPLSLTIDDAATLQAVALALDDAVLEAKDISYDPETQVFRAVLDRETREPGHGRVRCRLTLESVSRAHIQIDDDIPSLLTGIRYDPRTREVELGIGGPMRVVLQVEKLTGELADTGEPVPDRPKAGCCCLPLLAAAACAGALVSVCRSLVR